MFLLLKNFILKTLKSFVSGIFNENIEKDFIPIQKVKDKIEELSKTKGDLATHIAVSERIRALQEILEESEGSKDGEN